jgi:transcriptional regulator with XRE-family HTH domain
MNNFLSRIVDYRKAKGLTQKEMAEKLGIGQVSYSQIETGKTEISLQRIASIARILEVDLITLLFPDYNDAKYFQALKDENARMKKTNDLLINLVESKNTVLGLLLQMYPETEHVIKAHKFYNDSESLMKK